MPNTQPPTKTKHQTPSINPKLQGRPQLANGWVGVNGGCVDGAAEANLSIQNTSPTSTKHHRQHTINGIYNLHYP